MLVYFRDGSARTIVRAATETEVAEQTFYLTQSQYTDIGPIVPTLILLRQASYRAAIGVPIFKGIEPGLAALEVDGLATRPTRRQTKRKR